MSVVRLEITVPDDRADALAEELHRQHVRVSALTRGWRSARVEILTDARVTRERTILAAAAYFLPEEP